MSHRADRRRQDRRRQHVEVTRGVLSAGPRRGAAISAEVAEARWVTVRLVSAIAFLIGAQFLHWGVIDQHAREWRAAGVFFFVVAFGEGLMTILVISQLRPWVAKLGILVSVVPVVVWAWDRSLGLPFGPTKGVRGTIGRSDVLSVVFELLTIVALWPFMRPTYGMRGLGHLDLVSKIATASIVVYVAGFSYWAMLGDQGAIHRAAEATAVVSDSVVPDPRTAQAPIATTRSALVPTQTLSYAAKEYSFNGPATVSAGVTRINLHNLGDNPHELEVIRVPDSAPTPSSNADLEKLFGDTRLAKPGASEILAATDYVPAGASSSLTVHLTTGKYMLGSAIAGPNGAYDYAQGMITLLTVTAPVDSSTALTTATELSTAG